MIVQESLRLRGLIPTIRRFAGLCFALLVVAGAVGMAWGHRSGQPDGHRARLDKTIAGFEDTDRIRMPEPGGVVFVGSSSIGGWESLQEDFPGVNVIRRGFGGSQLADSVRYARRIITRYRPTKVVVYAGDKDIFEGKDAERVLADFKRLVHAIHDVIPEADVGFIAIKPSPARWELWNEMDKANGLIADYAGQRPHVTYLDIATPMLGTDGKPRPELFLANGLHMAPAGYEVWTTVIRPWLSDGRDHYEHEAPASVINSASS